ncbi:MAG: hypothetical protein WD928_14430 [Gammaproteobacteria bacterium]
MHELGKLALILVVVSTVRAAHATDFRLLSSWTPAYPGVPHIVERYVRKVEQAGNGEFRFFIIGPDSIPPFDQYEATAIGIFDVVFTHGSFHADSTGMGLALDTIEADPASMREAGVWDAVDQHYRARGLKLLALPVSRAGYQLLLRDPISADCDLAGRDIDGAEIHGALLETLGATRKQGARDGVVWPTLHAADPAWLGDSRYYTRPTFGAYTHMLLMNLATWNTLSDESQAVLLNEGVQIEVRAWKRSWDYAARAEALLNQQGVQSTAFCGDTLTLVPRHWADGVWRTGLRGNDAAVHRVRELAREAGITPP